MDLIKIAEEAFATGKQHPSFKAGDTVTVAYRIIEGNKERVQLYRGVVIKIAGHDILYNEDVRTVKDLLEIVSGRGWKSLLRIEGVGKTSYYHLLSKLQMIGVVDESLDRILAGCSNGKFDNK